VPVVGGAEAGAERREQGEAPRAGRRARRDAILARQAVLTLLTKQSLSSAARNQLMFEISSSDELRCNPDCSTMEPK